MILPGSPHFQADVDEVADFYPIAADGVVEREAGSGQYLFRVTKEYRGLSLKSYPLGGYSTCALSDPELQTLVGKPIFALLGSAHENDRTVFEMGRCVNGQQPSVEAALRERVASTCNAK